MHPLLRFTLDLFESKQPPAPAALAQTAPETVANKVSEALAPLAPAASSATFRHPRANREARLHDTLVAYELQRGKRKTIGFSVGPQGLVVRAPSWLPLRDVDTALHEKAHWIISKLGQSRERHERAAAGQIEWRDGTTIPFLGEPLTVLLTPQPGWRTARAELRTAQPEQPSSGAPLRRLHLNLAPPATPEQIQHAVQVWLMQQAKLVFAQRLDHFAPQLQVQWRKLSLSNANTRWGSARSDGAIRLNWRLLHLRQPLIDYVVAHELSHLRVMDHSPRFWATVGSVLPDYALLRRQLKDEAVPRWK